MEKLIAHIRALDLAIASDEEIINLLQKIGKIVLAGAVIPAGNFINRTRSDSEYIPYCYEKDISYISDPTRITDYNRASLKGNAIFYGCTPAFASTDENYCQVLSMMESGKLIHTNGENHIEEYATIGKWRVVKDITVLPIAYHADCISKDRELEILNKAYLKFIEQFPDKIEELDMISQYLAGEFAKAVSSEQKYNYKISAAFSQIVFDRGAEGIIYPSAIPDSKGYNVALPPHIVDTHLKLEKVAVFRLQKEKEVFIHPYLYCDSFHEDGKFIYQEAPSRVPRHLIAQKLSGQKLKQ